MSGVIRNIAGLADDLNLIFGLSASSISDIMEVHVTEDPEPTNAAALAADPDPLAAVRTLGMEVDHG